MTQLVGFSELGIAFSVRGVIDLDFRFDLHGTNVSLHRHLKELSISLRPRELPHRRKD